MKKSEIIAKYYDEIREAMIDRHNKVIASRGRIQYKVYIWEDGELEAMQQPQGDHSYLVPHDGEERELFFVTTVAEPGYDPRDLIDETLPDDEEAREALFQEADDCAQEAYKQQVDDLIDDLIADAEREERFAD